MKLDSQFFQGRYWLPALSAGVVIFLLLTVYFGYLIWQNSRTDLSDVLQLKELQSLSANASFLSEKVITGDDSAVVLFSTTTDTMQADIKQLGHLVDASGDILPSEFNKTFALWGNIEDDANSISSLKDSIVLLKTLESNVKSAAITAERLTLDNLQALSAADAPEFQLIAVSRQSMLLRQMADDLGLFVAQSEPNRQAFDNYQSNLDAFETNHSVLMNGDFERNLSPISNAQVRANMEQVNELVKAISSANRFTLSAAERLLLTRTAGGRLEANIDSLQLSLASMLTEIESSGANSFPAPFHLILTMLAAAACILGLVFYRNAIRAIQTDKEQEKGKRTQSAILRLLDELVDLADGDLTISATVSEDFTGAIADSINFTIDQLRQLVSRINRTAVEVSHAAQGTQQTALHLAEASDHQAQEIAGASAAINEMAVTIDQVSANASESALVAGKSVSIANNGAKLVQNTIHGMDTIREQIQDTSKRIKRLGESSQEIGDIVSLINDIADQTNILALNAAIQASMAGDAGRGFAVVADEVQRLAERSAAATKQIETIVKTIQTDTNEAVISMEQTTSEVVTGARLAQDAGVALEEIEGVSANLAELIQNISNAARQQASSAGHISNTMNVIQEITSQTSSGTNATAESIGDLANMALELRESVAGFTLPAEMIADLEQQEMATTADTYAAPPTLDNSIDMDYVDADAKMDELLGEFEMGEEGDDVGDFFELLSGDGEDSDDLLSELDIDLSDIEFAEDGKSVG